MITKYKSAAYYFDPGLGLTPDVIVSLDNWLNAWLKSGYTIDKMTDIIKEGKCIGYLFVFKVESNNGPYC